MNRLQLTPHFYLDEFTKSETAARLGIKNEPDTKAVGRLSDLCLNVLEPLRKHYNSAVIISSGFRSNELNAAVHGRGGSQHGKGEAADIIISGADLREAFIYIRDNMDYDQVIYERTWIHVSYKREGNRKQALIARFECGTVTGYKAGAGITDINLIK
jgi:zinc D-Ala-D-Ala carboxypeptidase